ncbi:PH domain-containing protein [Saccharibacillus alkalitolerans]|uniref:PH domain-containing protein n=1 Tax=Saccharibacillus alkalitolerans TaxID=2705290 RepID=A0ABX0F428_9BACL|nr:PH domain-containing protein [Saccharibacillus alkalitolerans]NGZ74625.1 PH domain-containing protein [Saccharibacillus alkalitolerans]
MSGPKRMSPLYIAFSMLKMVRALLPIFILFGVRALSEGEFPPAVSWILGAALFLILLAGLTEMIGWRRFTYEEQSDRITIRRGLIQRKEKIIYYSRIHSVSMEQPLLQRLLGVVQLKIETPGGIKEGDGVLPVLRRREAERLQRALNERAGDDPSCAAGTSEAGLAGQTADEPRSGSAGSEEEGGAHAALQVASGEEAAASLAHPAGGETAGPDRRAAASGRPRNQEPVLLYRLGPGRLLQAALTEMNLGLAIAFVAGLFSFADDLMPDEWMNRLVTNAQSYMTGLKAVLILGSAALIAAWLLSLVLFIVKFSGFSLYREGERLSIRYGLLERKQFLFDPMRVQAVTVKEGWLRQLLGYAHVEVNVVSSSDEKETPALHPFIRRSEIPALLERTVPQFELAGAEFKPPKRALLGYMRTGLIVATAIAAVLIYFFPHSGGLWALLLIPVSAGLDYWSFRTSGASLHGDRLTFVNRGIAKQTHCTLRRHIVAFGTVGSRFQRRRDMLTLRAHLLGGSGGASFSVSRLERDDAERIYEWYSRERKSGKTVSLKINS